MPRAGVRGRLPLAAASVAVSRPTQQGKVLRVLALRHACRPCGPQQAQRRGGWASCMAGRRRAALRAGGLACARGARTSKRPVFFICPTRIIMPNSRPNVDWSSHEVTCREWGGGRWERWRLCAERCARCRPRRGAVRRGRLAAAAAGRPKQPVAAVCRPLLWRTRAGGISARPRRRGRKPSHRGKRRHHVHPQQQGHHAEGCDEGTVPGAWEQAVPRQLDDRAAARMLGMGCMRGHGQSPACAQACMHASLRGRQLPPCAGTRASPRPLLTCGAPSRSRCQRACPGG